MKKVVSFCLALVIFIGGFWETRALSLEHNIGLYSIKIVDASDELATPKSGGFVSREILVNSVSRAGSYWYYKDLTQFWGKNSKYIVEETVTVESSNTLSMGVIFEIEEALNIQYGVTYGTTVSNSSKIGREFPADSSKDSKLRFKVLMDKFNVSVTYVDTYYEVGMGYYDVKNNYSGTVSIPNKDEAYIEVYYK